MSTKNNDELVLCIAPISRGFGFALYEGHLTLLDWGVKQAIGEKNRLVARRVHELATRFRPDTIVLRANTLGALRQAPRLTSLPRVVSAAAGAVAADFVSVARSDIRERFRQVNATTKYEIAQVVAQQHPELEAWLPPKRKIWMSEDPRMAIFDAAAAGEVHFHWRRRAAERDGGA